MRRVALGLVLVGLAIASWAVRRHAMANGWMETVPHTVWLVAALVTDAEQPIDELGLDDCWSCPDDLWAWQRSMARAAMRRRCRSGSDSVRIAAVKTLDWVLPPREECTDEDRLLLVDLVRDPHPEVQQWAVLRLGTRLESPETDPLIRGILDDPASDYELRRFAFNGLLYRHGAFGGEPDEQLADLIIEGMADSGQIGYTSSVAAGTMLWKEWREPRLVEPLLAKARSLQDSDPYWCADALAAAWGHARDDLPTDVEDAIMSALPAIGRACMPLVEIAGERTFSLEVRLAILTLAMNQEEGPVVKTALDRCGELSIGELRRIEPQLKALDARAARRATIEALKPLLERLVREDGPAADASPTSAGQPSTLPIMRLP